MFRGRRRRGDAPRAGGACTGARPHRRSRHAPAVAGAETVHYKPGPAMPGLAETIRDVGRRPVRSSLTTAGIAIGVAALVLLGALSEKLSRLVEGGRDFATGQITVSGAGTGALTGMSRGGLLSAEQLAQLADVP